MPCPSCSIKEKLVDDIQNIAIQSEGEWKKIKSDLESRISKLKSENSRKESLIEQLSATIRDLQVSEEKKDDEIGILSQKSNLANEKLKIYTRSFENVPSHEIESQLKELRKRIESGERILEKRAIEKNVDVESRNPKECQICRGTRAKKRKASEVFGCGCAGELCNTCIKGIKNNEKSTCHYCGMGDCSK